MWILIQVDQPEGIKMATGNHETWAYRISHESRHIDLWWSMNGIHLLYTPPEV